MRRAWGLGSVVVLLGAAPWPAARAADAEGATASARFGNMGSAVVALGGAGASRTAPSDVAAETRSYTAAANLGIFVENRWSVGLGLGLTRSSSTSSDGDVALTSFRVGPRLGRLFPIGSFVSVWPEIGIGYARSMQSSSSSTVIFTGLISPSWLVELDVPVLLHPSRYFFIGAGPVLSAGLSSSIQSVSLGSRLSFGLSFDAGG